MACEKARCLDLVHELSIVAQSVESTLSEKEVIDEKVRGLLKQPAILSIADVVKITMLP